MTQEEKELILKDLCARQPYNPEVRPRVQITYQQQGVKGTEEGNINFHIFEKVISDLKNGVILDIKPFLRPLSSMTEEEDKEYTNIDNMSYSCPKDYAHIPASNRIDWLNTNHFDYRGLIGKGLAIEAPKGMYNIK